MSEDTGWLRTAFRDTLQCRIGTVRPDGGPHVDVRWFVWLEDALWVATGMSDRTWEHANRDPRVSILIDRGRDWVELAGVRVEGVAEPMPAEHPDLREPMSAWHDKYRSLLTGEGFERLTTSVRSLGFRRVAPARIATWDHRLGG
ncbi:MAG: pyridoxamine 5'-phosphate oxidase family protein [Actinomycetota bacterium]